MKKKKRKMKVTVRWKMKEADEEVKEKYDKVVLGGNKGDKSKTHSEDYEKKIQKAMKK